MKKLLFITIFLFYGITNSQETGTWVFGGDVNFSSLENEDLQTTQVNTLNQFGITAKTGYIFGKSNIEVGLGLNYTNGKNENNSNTNTSKYQSYGITPYLKKYFILNDKFSFFLQGEVSFSNNKTEYNNNTNTTKGNSFFTGIRPGFVYFVTNNLALNANIGALGFYSNKNKIDGVDMSKSNSFNFNLNSTNLQFGIAYYL